MTQQEDSSPLDSHARFPRTTPVRLSGQPARLSGQPARLSGQPARLSGQIVGLVGLLAITLSAWACASGGQDGPDASIDVICAVCDSVAQCDVASGRATCTCPVGYQDIQGDGSNCRDVDECATNSDDCDDRADCSNTQGSYNCACRDGYAGDGLACADIDECQNGDTCDINATCMNYDGSFTCTCDSGYQGDGFLCEDIDECAVQSDQCDIHATCANEIGSYTCTCDPGWTGDGFTCTDIDECTLNTDECVGLTVCSNLPGTYECVCPPGYLDEFDDGTSCLLAAAGRVFLIGHDYFINNADNNRLLGNAVFSANTTGSVEILAFTAYADNSAGQEVSSVNAAINARAAELGKSFTLSTFNDYTQLSNQILGKDVLLIYEQETASAALMTTIGQNWEIIVQTFVKNGGVVVITDFDGSTWQLVNRSGLMNISSTGTLVSGTQLLVQERGNDITTNVATSYPATTGTRYYNSNNAVPIVVDSAGRAVILTRTIIDACVTVADFESALWPDGVWYSPSGATSGTIRDYAAHDFTYGIVDPNWHYQADITAGEVGDRLRVWMRLSSSLARVSLGFGSRDWGTFSIEANAWTDRFTFLRHLAYTGGTELSTIPFNLLANQWYFLELQFGGGGLVTARLYEPLNPNPLISSSTTIAGLEVGGVAIRGSGGGQIDTVQVCPAP